MLVTGASGFVGRALLTRLVHDGTLVHAAIRRAAGPSPAGVVEVNAPDLGQAGSEWTAALRGVTVVAHCAARVHVLRDPAVDPLAEYRRVNLAGTLNLARQSVAAGVRRFIFISSIGVNGAETFGTRFTSEDTPAPHSPYAVSKLEAEIALRQLAKDTGLEVVIVRPPLVFGPNAPGNFDRLMRVIARGIPLPFGSVTNQRSLVALSNLVDLIAACVDHPKAANQTFMVSDGEDISTTDLLKRLAIALGRPARLLPVPVGVLRAIAQALGKADFAQRLCGSLQVDVSHTRRLLDWAPVVRLDDALADTARQFLARAGR